MSAQNAARILKRGIELDQKMRYTESLICYQEGLQMLLNEIKDATGDQKAYLRQKVEEYMRRAEQIKALISKMKIDGNYHEQVRIDEGSTGHSYANVFGRFLDEHVTSLTIHDPYIRTYHQCQNLVRLCEIVVMRCHHLTAINLTTVKDKQENYLDGIRTELLNHNVQLNVTYSDTLHDREITLNTGWIIKIGRGLDYFKPPKSKFALGLYDLDLRPCHETIVDIFHSNNVKCGK